MRFSDEAVLRLLVAVALGALIGAERETSEQSAGLRTHIAVSLGACLFGVISTLGFREFEHVRATTNVQIDVTRVASQVVVGIGFLGAGVIFRQGTTVKNLTTAASLWATAAIGLACGVGDLGTAAVATGIMLIALVALLPPRDWLRERVTRDSRELRVRMSADTSPDELIDHMRTLDGVSVDRLVVEKLDGSFVIVVELKAGRRVNMDDRIGELSRRSDVVDLEDLAD